ncbi:MAG: CPBP family intramembrane metalloprotease [Elusimicrobia bacterium]|nr:CPBP family intramembrane metalloprotease [Elusimicrobiota bacterium]
MDPQLIRSLDVSITSAGLWLGIGIAYVLVVRVWWKVPFAEAVRRAGIAWGNRRDWAFAAAFLLPWLAFVWASYRWMPVTAADTTSPYRPFLGKGVSVGVILAALTYGIVAAGFGEELFFRGLIAGALGRRMALWKANLVQTFVFLAPHLLILLIKPAAAPILIGVAALAATAGWLRLRSGSIGPGLMLHGLGNTFVAMLAAASSQ